MSTYHHGNLPRTLLTAAAEMLESDGLTGLSLRDVARRAGVSHNAPYRHFSDREALLAELAVDGFRMLGEALAKKPANDMGEAYVRFALDHPQRFRLMFGGQLPIDGYQSLKDAAGRAYDALVDAFRVQTGVADPEIAAAAAWSLVHGLAHLLLDGHFASRKKERFIGAVLGAVRFV